MRKTGPEYEDAFQSYRNNVKKCTDVPWNCLLIAFWVVLTVIAAFSIIYGNYLVVANGYDSFGNVCGIKNNWRFENFTLSGHDTSSSPFLIYSNIVDIPGSLSLCIQACPTKIISEDDTIFEYWNFTPNVKLCRYDFDMHKLLEPKINYMSDVGPCLSRVTDPNTPVRQLCIPAGRKVWIGQLYRAIDPGAGTVQLFFLYVYLAWPFVCGLSGLGLVLSVILFVLIRLFPRLASWLSCICVLIATTFFCIALWFAFLKMSNEGNEEEHEYADNDEGIFYDLIKAFNINKSIILALGIISPTILVVLIGVMIFFRKEIKLAATLVEEAVRCLVVLRGFAAIPFVEFVGTLLFIWFWSYIVLCMVSASDPEVHPLNVDEVIEFKSRYNMNYTAFEQIVFVEKKAIRDCVWVYFIALIWTTEFIFACKEFILGAAVAHWYFKSPQHWYTPSTIVETLFKYHLGTVAKGSLLITLFKIPRWIVAFLQATKLNNPERKSSNYFGKSVIDSLQACFSSAYTVTVMESIDFNLAGTKARKAMDNSRNLENAVKIADFVLFLGKLSVAFMTCAIGILILRAQKDLLFFMAPAIFSSVVAFFMAHIVLSLIEIPMDTLVLCLCEDKRFYGRRGAWMQNNLLKFLDPPNKGQHSVRGIQFIEVKHNEQISQN